MSEPYMVFALQPKVYGCADRKEAKKNLKNLCAQKRVLTFSLTSNPSGASISTTCIQTEATSRDNA